MEKHTSVVGVAGLGTMGEGIVRALLSAGVEVVGVDTDDAAVSQMSERLAGASLTLSTELSDLKHADVVFEAVPDVRETKESVLRGLTRLCAPDTLLVTTTGVVPLERLAIDCGRPDRLVGLRTFLPPPFCRSAEVVTTAMTASEAAESARELVLRLGWTEATVDSRAGAAAVELVYAYLNRAAELSEEGYATADDIDAAMRFGCGLPHGPLRMLDMIGIETVRSELAELVARTGDDARRPASVLEGMVADGKLGRKAGTGFHSYDEAGHDTDTPVAVLPCPADAHEIGSVGIVGSGTMARGVAEAMAVRDIPVMLVARTRDRADEALAAMHASLVRAVRKGRISARERDTALERITVTTELSDLAEHDLVLEAVAESLEVKQTIFASLDQVARPGAVLATVTSSLPVAACADATSRPADVIGIHFFNPAQDMRLVEVVHTAQTSDTTVATAHALAARLGKYPVHCSDRTGFIVNFLLFPYLADAIAMLERDGVTIEALDDAVVAAFGYPMGPFTLLDAIGLDVSLVILLRLRDAFGLSVEAPVSALEGLIAAGRLGRKSGGGFRAARRPRGLLT